MPQLQPLEKVYKFKKVQKLKESRKVHKLQVVQQITQVTVVNSIYIVIEYVNVNSFFFIDIFLKPRKIINESFIKFYLYSPIKILD